MLFMLGGMLWVAIFFGISYSQDQKLNSQLATTVAKLSGWTPSVLGTPEALAIDEDGIVVPSENGRFDIVTFVTNPNAQWGAVNVGVNCDVDGTIIALPAVTVNPDEHRPVMAQGQNVKGTAARCTIASQTWNRENTALFPQPSFSVIKNNVTNTTAVVGGVTVPVVRVAATIRNDSGNNFQTVDVAMIVRRGETIVAADILPINRWETRGTKEVTNTWTVDSSSNLDVEIVPLVNRYNPEATY
jgi:hypothetical protein